MKLSIIHGSPYDDYINANYMPVRTDTSLAQIVTTRSVASSGSVRKLKRHLPFLRLSWGGKKTHNMCVLFYLAGLQLQEGVHRSSGSSAHHGQRFLENDLGEERSDSGHADPLQRARTSERRRKRGALIPNIHVGFLNVCLFQVKCEQYWDFGTRHFENINVTAVSDIPLEDWTIRDFDIKNVSGGLLKLG